MTHYSPLVSALATLILTLILSLNKKGMIQDPFEEPTLRSGPIPSTGGIALIAGILAGWVLLFKFWAWWVVLPVLGLFLFSLVEDMRELSDGTRWLIYLAAALCVSIGAGVDWLWMLPVLLYVVWMTRLYSLMDAAQGSDGMAGGMALSGFTFFGFAALKHGDAAFAMLSFSVGAAALGFLYHNFPPAKVSLGKAGSIPLGFLAAGFGVWGWQQGYWPFWFPVLVFSPFVMDATLTALNAMRNKLAGVYPEHYYQRLVRTGWGQKNTVLAEYVLMVLAGISALAGLGLDAAGQGNLLAWWGAIYLGMSMWIDRRWRVYQAVIQDSEDAA